MSQDSTDESGVDKFDGSFDQEQSGCTIFVNTTVNSIKRLDVGGLYMYLTCRPSSWKLNVKHLASLFMCNKDKIYGIIDTLIEMNLLTRREIRNKGRFVRFHYRLHLRPEECASVQCTPVLEKPDTVKPDTVNPDAYKTKSIINKEDINNITPIDSATDIARKRNDDAFDEFWKGYPVKKNKVRSKKIWDREKFASIVTLICCDVLTRSKHEPQWQDKQFIPHPATYLGNKLWTDEVTEASTPKKSSGGKSSSFDQYQADLQKQNRGETYEHGAIPQ
ncbi:hypothetical protein CCP3SC1AL1_1170014 [Gammaproteobacteria bacterium]|jgi:hypothetical protein